MLLVKVRPEFDSDEEAPQPQTRQERRGVIREKAIETARRNKLLKQQAKPNRLHEEEPKPGKKTKAKQELLAQRRAAQAPIDFGDWVDHVATLILNVAVDFKEFVPLGNQWVEGALNELIDSLARDHQVVDKYRQAYASTSRFEHRIINAAIMQLELDGDLKIQTVFGFSRLVALHTSRFCQCEEHLRFRGFRFRTPAA